MDARPLMNLKVGHSYDPVPQGIVIFAIEFLVQRIHNVSTALVVESAAVIPLEQCPLLTFQSPFVYLRFTILLASGPLHAHAHLIYVLIGPNYLSAVLLVITLPVDSLSINLFFLIGPVVFKVFQLLFNFLFVFISVGFIPVLIFIILFFSEFLQDLYVFSRGVLIEGLAPIMNNVDFPVLIDNIAVMERPV